MLEPNLGLIIIVETDLDPQEQKTIQEENGFFPIAILDRAVSLNKLMFRELIDEFTEKIKVVQKSERKIIEKTRDLVITTINKLLSKHPSFKGNIGQFMQLDHFEKLLQLASPASSEHIFHSFRVFLAGCPIIHANYDHFVKAHNLYSVSCREVRVEYAWLLTSIFHDIGYSKEKAVALIKDELQDDDIDIQISGKDSRWSKPGYRDALRILSSLAAFLGSNIQSTWAGGGIHDQEGETLEADWIRIYDQLSSHAVISALDFLKEICDKAKAADYRKHLPFVLAHSVPAALAILLHDWRIQEDAKRWKLFPVSVEKFPIAALLIYLDTWDDYKRKEPYADIFIKEYKIDEKGAEVYIEWGDSIQFENEKKKYASFKKSLREKTFEMEISARMAEL